VYNKILIQFRRVQVAVIGWFWLGYGGVRYVVQIKLPSRIKILSPYKFTFGFLDFKDFEDHLKHSREHVSFGRWAFTYARFADAFCGGPRDAAIWEHTRLFDGAIIRCDPNNRIVGILRADGFIGTCHVRGNFQNWFQKEQLR